MNANNVKMIVVIVGLMSACATERARDERGQRSAARFDEKQEDLWKPEEDASELEEEIAMADDGFVEERAEAAAKVLRRIQSAEGELDAIESDVRAGAARAKPGYAEALRVARERLDAAQDAQQSLLKVDERNFATTTRIADVSADSFEESVRALRVLVERL